MANRDERGVLLIGSYLILSLFLIYSSALTIRTSAQQLGANRTHDQFQAMDLAQAAMEQIREDLYAGAIHRIGMNGDVLGALAWIDSINAGPATNPNFYYNSEANAMAVTLPGGTGTAWVESVTQVDPLNQLSARDVVIQAMADVGGVRRRIRSLYRMDMGMSDIFRYAYFVNNYGWLAQSGSTTIEVYGDVRANGDLAFSGAMGSVKVNGDAYASANPDVINPITNNPATGTIAGDPTQDTGWSTYWANKPQQARPAEELVGPSRPAIAGSNPIYPLGWDSDVPQQAFYPQQAVQDIPYMGDLELYRTMATLHNGGAGSTVSFRNIGADGTPGTADDYNDSVASNYTASQPLILIGTVANPIVLDGPFVADGDVIIRGVVTGKGSIYAGRNVHVVGSITYNKPLTWLKVERDTATGRLKETLNGTFLGTVCTNGTYITPTGTVPIGCAP